MIKGIFIVGAKRTAFGTFGGTLKNVTGTQLQAHACKAALESAGVRPDQVDTVIIGNVLVVCIFFLLLYTFVLQYMRVVKLANVTAKK